MNVISKEFSHKELWEVRPNQMERALRERGWFTQPGAYVLVDGQFGSTGKGLLAAWLAEHSGGRITFVTTNAGPNSGHTAYYENERIMTQQLPIATVIIDRMAENSCWCRPFTYLNSGAVVNYNTYKKELGYLSYHGRARVEVSAFAAMIDEQDLKEPDSCSAVASTNKGVGPAMARKLLREPSAVCQDFGVHIDLSQIFSIGPVFVETAQGYSLGLNAGFYPYCTSRQCTVAQALADANCPPDKFRKSVVSFRTYPIRVGNTDKGHSGGWYKDQEETTWEDIGVEPELTTITKRKRRVATWSWDQFRQAIHENAASAYFLNFMNYLPEDRRAGFIEDTIREFVNIRGNLPDFVLLGYGPKNYDVGMIA